MAQVNKCLKGLFVCYNSLFLFGGVLLITFMVKAKLFSEMWQWYIIGGATVVIACLGLSGVSTSKKWALTLYSLLLCAAMIYSLYNGIEMEVNRAEVVEVLAYYLDEDELRHFKGLHDGAVGMEFGFAVAAFLGLAMAVPLLCQMSRQDRSSPPVPTNRNMDEEDISTEATV